jgi:hypothetical protein
MRAVTSVRASSRGEVKIIAVVNGNRSDPDVLSWLTTQPDVHCEYLDSGSAPLAQLHGRELVNTEFFSFLDDDDEYLPGATDMKVERLDAHADAAMVVTNGFYQRGEVERVFYDHLSEVRADPLTALFRENWLNGDNALFRAARVPVDYFRNPHPYCEWTWLAYRLAMDRQRVEVLERPAFRCHDSPNSLSKSAAYMSVLIPLCQRMLDRRPPPPVARLIKRRVASTYHTMSSAALRRGDWRGAWRAHLRSLGLASGWRYLSYTRHLLARPRSHVSNEDRGSHGETATVNGASTASVSAASKDARPRIPRNA